MRVLTFDRPGSSANILDAATFDALEAALEEAAADGALRGLVVSSAKPKIFVAGADLNLFRGELTGDAMEAVLRRGQDVFSLLARLKLPTVAAVHGACLGGGLELALACRWRLASDDPATRLGLPEVQLGILPAWGGTTRLPRLIGLPRALGMILEGNPVDARRALKLGLVDGLHHRETLLGAACRLAAEGRAPVRRRPWVNLSLAAALAGWLAGRQMRAVTRGNYPAPRAALRVATDGLQGPVEASLALEREAFRALAAGPECRNLVRVFFLQEAAKKLTVGAGSEGGGEAAAGPAGEKFARAAVVGAGVMGAGIAQWLASRGLRVILKDIAPEALARGLGTARSLFEAGAKRRIFSPSEARAGLDRIWPAAGDVPLANEEIVVEAVVENLDLKQRVLAGLEKLAGPATVLATNTSALSIDKIADTLSDPSRLVGIHFFNPVHRMKLVEVVAGERTSPAAVAAAVSFVKQVGKLPVLVRDRPGFLVNRILMPYLVEAVRLYAAGGDPRAIDDAMLDFGMPMGPLRLLDEVGLDVAQHVAADLSGRLDHLGEVPPLLAGALEAGDLGKKAGRGFYRYDKGGKRASPNPGFGGVQRSVSSSGRVSDGPGETERRLVLTMVNEAARCLEEEVVSRPGEVDFGMIFGTGWAPFRGGPLRYADALGVGEVTRQLESLAVKHGSRFQPCELLLRLARDGGTFYHE